MGKRKEDDTFLWKKTEEKRNSATIVISVDGNGTIFQWSWNGNSLNKDIKKENFKF